MSRTFKDSYYESDNFGRKNQGKSSKQKRQKIKDYLRNIEDFDEDFEDVEEFNEND